MGSLSELGIWKGKNCTILDFFFGEAYKIPDIIYLDSPNRSQEIINSRISEYKLQGMTSLFVYTTWVFNFQNTLTYYHISEIHYIFIHHDNCSD